MHCKQWIFDMDGTLTDSMQRGVPGRVPRRTARAAMAATRGGICAPHC